MSKGKTILAIDDEADMLEFYQVALSGFGEIRLARNMAEARSQLTGVDLIILDFHLENDAEKFQEIVPELRKTAPVLLCSGVQDERVPVLGSILGIEGYWHKASGLPKLHALVHSALGA